MNRPALARLRSGAAGVQFAVMPRDAPVVLLDEVRVEARRRGHDQDLPGTRVERDDGPAVRAELLLRDLLGIEVERRHDVVPLDRPAVELVERLVEDRREVCVGGGQVVVERSLEPRTRPSDGRVADDVCGKRAVRVAAEVERLAVDDALSVPRQPPPRLEREDEARGRPRTPRRAGSRCPASRRDRPAAHVCQYVVMTTRTPMSARATYVSRMICAVHRGVFARFDTSRSSARSTKFATMLVPP